MTRNASKTKSQQNTMSKNDHDALQERMKKLEDVYLNSRIKMQSKKLLLNGFVTMLMNLTNSRRSNVKFDETTIGSSLRFLETC